MSYCSVEKVQGKYTNPNTAVLVVVLTVYPLHDPYLNVQEGAQTHRAIKQ